MPDEIKCNCHMSAAVRSDAPAHLELDGYEATTLRHDGEKRHREEAEVLVISNDKDMISL